MPLPPNGQPWPPPQLAAITPVYEEHAAWYSGDVADLASVYQRATPSSLNRPAQYRGGITGTVARLWWGQPVNTLTQSRRKLHVPIAADLCQAGADLLFAEPPTVSVADAKTQDRLSQLADDGMFGLLAEAAEIAGALGGVFLRVSWDDKVLDRPFLTKVDADAACPEFRSGRLWAVTFWWRVRVDGQRVWRHLERHEHDATGNGIILHGLYEGDATNLGRAVPLVDDPSTKALATLPGLIDGQIIPTLSKGLAVAYVPNQRPQRRWRNDPLGANLGRSTLDGVEGLMDALDEAYTSWMRDIRLGKARITIPGYMLDSTVAGSGATFDLDREVYDAVNATPQESAGITLIQPAIRYEAHQATVSRIITDIIRSAGFSAQTLGEGAGSTDTAITATEVSARERRSNITRDRQIRIWRPAMGDIVEKLLAIDAALFGSAVTVQRPQVDFNESVQPEPLATAQTAQALYTARAASTRTLVGLVHRDWDKAQIDDEVALILAEDGTAPDPSLFRPGVDGQPAVAS